MTRRGSVSGVPQFNPLRRKCLNINAAPWTFLANATRRPRVFAGLRVGHSHICCIFFLVFLTFPPFFPCLAVAETTATRTDATAFANPTVVTVRFPSLPSNPASNLLHSKAETRPTRPSSPRVPHFFFLRSPVFCHFTNSRGFALRFFSFWDQLLGSDEYSRKFENLPPPTHLALA